MKIRLLFLCILVYLSASGQYYYNDIVATQEINFRQKGFSHNSVLRIESRGFDNKGTLARDFSEMREISKNGHLLKISSFTDLKKSTEYYQFDDSLRLISFTDSISLIKNTTNYEYDREGHLIKIQNIVIDSVGDFNQVETHHWVYKNGIPEKMWRIVTNNGAAISTDSLEIRFGVDENGNIVEERSFRNGVQNDFLYYYYDGDNRMTDIVRYNNKLDKLIPDIMFEYDENDQVIQKITTTSDRELGYLIWRYIYNDNGLKVKEALFDNKKQLRGRIDYLYTFTK